MNKLSSTLFALALLHAQVGLAAATESARCALANDSLDATQALARSAWAHRCYPSLRGTMPDKKVSLRDTATGETFPGYPIFAKIDDEGNILHYWQAPLDPAASCAEAANYAFVGFCRAGCYTPDQGLLFSTGLVPIGEAKKALRTDIMTLAKEATLDRLSFQIGNIETYTVDQKDTKQPILVIQTKDGGELKVTLNHPLVDSEGVMRSASSLKVGEKLVKMDGEFDRIVQIKQVDYFGRVYNVQPIGDTANDNIVVAQGYLNGSVYYQNEGIKELNRAVLRAGNLISDRLIQ